MELRWMAVTVVACLALAAVIVVALSRRGAIRERRALANVDRLVTLPAYVRAMRIRRWTVIATLTLLAVAFGASVIAAARPSGLPTRSHGTATGQPEDVMVCVGAPQDDPATKAALEYFARDAQRLGTGRIGLTTANRRVIPVTRDHQFASGRFAQYAGAPATDFAPDVRYSDYAESTADVITLCLTGFPGFDRPGAQRRSLVYVGPADLRPPGEALPALYDVDRLTTMAKTAGVQVNVLATGTGTGPLDALARDTGGRAYSAQANVDSSLGEIRDHPPPPNPEATDAARTAVTETPDVPLIVAALAAAVLAVLTLRRWFGSPRRSRAPVWRAVGLAVAAALLVLAATRPVVGTDRDTTPAGAGDGEPNVFLVVDRSPDMGVDDAAGRSRMAAARDDLAALVDRYPNARFTVLTFASGPAVDWPLSADTWSLRPSLAALAPYGADAVDPTRVNAAAAATVLRYQLISARQQFPLARNLVYYAGAGAPESQVPQRDFEVAEGSVDGGAVLGYGAGRNEPALRRIADQLDVPYVARTDADPLPDAGVAGATRPVAPPRASNGPTELYWIPASLAAVLILVELYLVLRELRRNRPTALGVTR